MRWAKTSLRNSFFGWMANEAVPEASDDLEVIRKAMLQTLDQGGGDTHTAIERKLLFAHDVDQLWYARPELMNALAATRGEAAARACMDDITRLFQSRNPDRFGRKRGAGPRRG
jgi:hypothetical protein